MKTTSSIGLTMPTQYASAGPFHDMEEDLRRKILKLGSTSGPPSKDLYPRNITEDGKAVWAQVIDNYMGIFEERCAAYKRDDLQTYKRNNLKNDVLWSYAVSTFINVCHKLGIRPFTSWVPKLGKSIVRGGSIIVDYTGHFAVVKEPGYTRSMFGLKNYVPMCWMLVSGKIRDDVFQVSKIERSYEPKQDWPHYKRSLTADMIKREQALQDKPSPEEAKPEPVRTYYSLPVRIACSVVAAISVTKMALSPFQKASL